MSLRSSTRTGLALSPCSGFSRYHARWYPVTCAKTGAKPMVIGASFSRRRKSSHPSLAVEAAPVVSSGMDDSDIDARF